MTPPLVRVGFVVHVMQVAGVEILVRETIDRLRDAIHPTVFCLDAVGPLGLALQAQGIDVVSLNRRPGIDVQLIRRMTREIARRRIAVLHAHQYTPFFYAALASRLVRPRPHIIFTEHGRHFPDTVLWKRRLVNRLLFDRIADRVNAVCAFSAESLARVDGFRRNRIQVIENGIDLARYGGSASRVDRCRRAGLDAERRYVVCVARFHPVKDHRTLIAAFRQVAEARDDVDLLLVGEGAMKAAIEEMVRWLRLETRVRLMGVRHDLAEWLPAADVFALTSVSEAAPLTVLEAMAAGIPTVATGVGGVPDMVRDGQDGILVPRGDCQAVATAILRLLDDRALAARLGRSARAHVEQRYRIERTVGQYLMLYRELSNLA